MSIKTGNILLEVLVFLALSLLFFNLQAMLFHDLATQEKEISRRDNALDLRLGRSIDSYLLESTK